MAEPIRTSVEIYVERLLNYLQIPNEINRILCFQCNGARFYWNSHELPRQCAIGLHALTKGGFCRPDVIIKSQKFPMPVRGQNEKIGVLRIDGSIHDKRRIMKRDKMQEFELARLNIPYFVTTNDDWYYQTQKGRVYIPEKIDYSRIPRAHFDYLISIYEQVQNDNLYKKYLDIKEIKDSRLI